MQLGAIKESGARRVRHIATIGTIAAMCTTTAALGQGAGSAAAASGPTHGGSLTMTQLGIENNLDPAIGNIANYPYAPAMEAVYGPGLSYITPAQGKVLMGFAKSMTPSDHDKVWTITLRPGLKFSDGTAFNAAAVAYNINRDKEHSLGSPYEAIAKTLKPKVVNATTLTVTLPSPNSQFPALVAADFGAIGSPTAIKKEGQNFGTKPVGAGPFILKNTVLNTSETLVKNPRFYVKGQPYLNTLTLQALSDYTAQVNAVQTGAAQMAWSSDGQVFKQFENAGVHVQKYVLQGPLYLMFNNQSPPFNNRIAREAVYDALNRSAVSNAWAPGNAVSETFFSKSSALYSPVKWPAPNRAKAQQLFNQLASEGHPANFTLMLPQGYPTLGPTVQAELDSLKNVKVTVKTEITSEYETELQQGTYQMTAYGFSAPTPEPFLTDLYLSTGDNNFERWSDPKVDAALNDYLSTSNVAKQRADWKVVSTEIAKQFPVVPIFQGQTSLDWKTSKVGGVVPVWYGETPMWNEVYLKS